MLFFHLYKIIFFFNFCVFLYKITNSLNIDNYAKALAFKKFKRLLYKYYPKFVKTFKIHPNKFDIKTVSCSFI